MEKDKANKRKKRADRKAAGLAPPARPTRDLPKEAGYRKARNPTAAMKKQKLAMAAQAAGGGGEESASDEGEEGGSVGY